MEEMATKVMAKINSIQITTILRSSLLLTGLAPLVVAVIAATPLLDDDRFNLAMVLGVLVALSISWLLGSLVVNGLFMGAIKRLQDFCLQVKQGKYDGFDDLPGQGLINSDENEFISLMRDMGWMARLIKKREQELRASIAMLKAAQDELNQSNACLAEMAMTDPLTRLYNRRYFFDHLEQECAHMNRKPQSVSLIMLDIDHFKIINDKYGHQTGDIVLTELSRAIEKTVRSGEIVARIGGEEFAVLVPDADKDGAVHIACRICREVREHVFKDDEGQTFKITCSAGITVASQASVRSADKLCKQADIALYAAKEAGRNRIYFYDHQYGPIEVTENGNGYQNMS